MSPDRIDVLHEGKFLRLLRNGRWEYVERRASPGAAFIVALTPARELVMVEQFRVPLQARTLELPAGIIGDEAQFADETVEASALRELEEETGFRGTQAQLLLAGPLAPGLTSEMLYLVRIDGLTRVHAGGGVDGEDITVHVVKLDEVPGFLEAQRARGLLIEPRIYAGLWFAGSPR